jgi:4-hydroxybenzoate polyprenyltransferase
MEPGSLWKAVVAFAAFCLASSAIYAVNDVVDREADARHPSKRHRAVARGAIHPTAALIFGCLLVILATLLATRYLQPMATAMVAVYFVLMMLYSLALKQRMILDVIAIAMGFVLRAAGGAAAVEVVISPWLVICTFMICMFLGFGKRRCEVATFANTEQAKEHRPTLVRYTPELLNHLISVTAGIAIITFVQYTMDDNPAYHPNFNKEYLLYTLPLVAYGVFRYAMLIESGKMHGPTDILFKDRPFLATVVLWGLIALGIVFEAQLQGWLAM